jgi:hypothetical protein
MDRLDEGRLLRGGMHRWRRRRTPGPADVERWWNSGFRRTPRLEGVHADFHGMGSLNGFISEEHPLITQINR